MTSRRRNFDETIINACQIRDDNVVDTLQLHPLVVFDMDGIESNASFRPLNESRVSIETSRQLITALGSFAG